MNELIMQDIETLRTWIRACNPGRMAFFGGAGVSVESGIPDFRSAGGIFSQAAGREVSPEQMVSHTYLMAHPQEFFDFYFSKMIFPSVQPNRAHRTLAALEEVGTCGAVVTQNIDGLHQAAGSKVVHELHGSIHRNYCTGCGATFTLDAVMRLYEQSPDGVPHCPECNSLVRPDVVLYEEQLDEDTIRASIRVIASADLLLIAGTSLVVWPAASFIDYFQGDHLAIVNLSPTPRDQAADLCIPASIGDVLDFSVEC